MGSYIGSLISVGSLYIITSIQIKENKKENEKILEQQQEENDKILLQQDNINKLNNRVYATVNFREYSIKGILNIYEDK